MKSLKLRIDPGRAREGELRLSRVLDLFRCVVGVGVDAQLDFSVGVLERVIASNSSVRNLVEGLLITVW